MKNIRELDILLEEFSISKTDKEMLKILLSAPEEGSPPTIFCSLTHIMHNYITLTHLFNLSKLCKLGCTLVIALWDMNILSNPYFKKMEFEKYRRTNYEQYIKEKKDEILAITTAFGIENVKIYTSSEMWTRFTQQKEPPLFPQYYSTLATMNLDEYDTNEKLHYLLQLPADVFFANFFQNLFPEDTKKQIDIVYTFLERKNLYFATRKAMYTEGLISTERPIMIISKEIPRIEIDAQIPHWDLSLSEINQIISKWQFSNEEIVSLYENVLKPVLPETILTTEKGNQLVETKKLAEQLSQLSRDEIVLSTSKNLLEYFRKIREKTKSFKEPRPDFYTIKSRKEAQQIGALLKSKNTLKILTLANGNRTVTEIAKETNMHLSNASQYITKLKKAGLVAIKDKKVSRTARGIKINFEATLTT